MIKTMSDEKLRGRFKLWLSRLKRTTPDFEFKDEEEAYSAYFQGAYSTESYHTTSRARLIESLDSLVDLVLNDMAQIPFSVLYNLQLSASRLCHEEFDLFNPNDAINKDVIHKYLKNAPYRVVFIRDLNTGALEGVTEESFSMGKSDTHVNVFWSGVSYSILGEHTLDGVLDARLNVEKLKILANDQKDFLIIDPLDPSIPIEFDWCSWLASTQKYTSRNIRWRIKNVS